METTVVKTPPDDPENPPRKPASFTNGVLKLRHAPPHAPLHAPPYKECLKNHAAAMGGHAVDGCGEFMSQPSSLLCAACGCHRNFHRRAETAAEPSDFQPLRRHHPPPPPPRSPNNNNNNSPSPPPISSSFFPSAHMLLSLSSNPNPNNNNKTDNNNPRRRFRTRFTQTQKDKMFEFAEKLAWKMQRKDEESINAFCNSIAVEKGVFKVWMHNNKNTLGKREPNSVVGLTNGISKIHDNVSRREGGDAEEELSGNNRVVVVGTNNGSSSSS